MKNLGTLKVSDKIAETIENNVRVHPTKPNTFYIVAALNPLKARNKILDLAKYFQKNFGALTYEEESYQIFETFSITDPVAGSIEGYLTELGLYVEAE